MPVDPTLKLGTETTPSGLIVPSGTQEKVQHTLLLDDMKKVFRTMRYLSEQGLGLVTMCGKCLRPATPSKDVQNVLECSCTKWVIR